MKYLNFALIVALGAFIYFQDLPEANGIIDSIDVDDNGLLWWEGSGDNINVQPVLYHSA